MDEYQTIDYEESLALVQALPAGVEITPVGMEITGDLSYGEWEELGVQLGRFSRASAWAIGDWLNHGEKKYGETYAQAIDVTGLSLGWLNTLKWLAGKFETSRRREVSLSHHEAVASLEIEVQDHLLCLAEQWGWAREDLREQVKKLKGIDAGNANESNRRNGNELGAVDTEPNQTVYKMVNRDAVYDKAVDVAKAFKLNREQLLYQTLNELAELLEDQI